MTEETTDFAEVASFTVEADHPRNCDLLIQAIPGLRLRSAIEGTRSVKDQKTGDEMVPADQSKALSALPRLPGMQIRVQPDAGLVIVSDPLNDDDVLKGRLAVFLRNHTQYQATTVEGVKRTKTPVDEHQMKTLCRELLNIVEAGEGRVVAGKAPSRDRIESMKGRFLQNSGHTSYSTQPRYEDQMPEWMDNLSRIG